LTSRSLDDFEADQAIREMQRQIERCTRENRALNLSYLVEAKSIVIISRNSGKFLLKVDLQPSSSIFCKITNVLAMWKYMERVGSVKGWDDHKSHTGVVRTPQDAFDELSRRMNSAVTAYRQRGLEFDQSRNP
jgi:hypothetical protein